MNIQDSQNFLHSTALVKTLLEKCNLSKDDTILEIGPGKGIITRELLKTSKKVIAVEYDETLYKDLLKTLNYADNLELINENFLNYALPDYEYKVVSNIPFNITADIMSKLLNPTNPPKEMYLIMQNEAMQKYAGGGGTECLKSLTFKPFFEFEKLYDFLPTDFRPVPSVNICFVKISTRKYCDLKVGDKSEYLDFIAYLYMAKGQTFKEKTKTLFSYEQLKRIRKQVKIDYEDKITTWKYESFLKLYAEFVRLVPQCKKSQIAGSFGKYQDAQSKLEKLHRNRKNAN